MTTNFEYNEVIKITGGKLEATLKITYGEAGKVLPVEEYSDLVKAAKALKAAIKKVAKEHKK